MRVGPDVDARWFDGTRPSVKHALRLALQRFWMHRRLWLNDPDCLVTRGPDATLPDHESEFLATGIALSGGVKPSHWTATIYPGPKKNFVFNASTIFWAQGLSSPPGHMLPWSHWTRPHGPDARVQRITDNLLRRALGRKLA